MERLDAEAALTSDRPNIPLNELTGGRIEALLSVVDRWIETVREAVGEIYCGGVSVCAAGVAGDDVEGEAAIAGGESDRSDESQILSHNRESVVEAIFWAGVV